MHCRSGNNRGNRGECTWPRDWGKTRGANRGIREGPGDYRGYMEGTWSQSTNWGIVESLLEMGEIPAVGETVLGVRGVVVVDEEVETVETVETPKRVSRDGMFAA